MSALVTPETSVRKQRDTPGLLEQQHYLGDWPAGERIAEHGLVSAVAFEAAAIRKRVNDWPEGRVCQFDGPVSHSVVTEPFRLLCR